MAGLAGSAPRGGPVEYLLRELDIFNDRIWQFEFKDKSIAYFKLNRLLNDGTYLDSSC